MLGSAERAIEGSSGGSENLWSSVPRLGAHLGGSGFRFRGGGGGGLDPLPEGAGPRRMLEANDLNVLKLPATDELGGAKLIRREDEAN